MVGRDALGQILPVRGNGITAAAEAPGMAKIPSDPAHGNKRAAGPGTRHEFHEHVIVSFAFVRE